MLQFETSERANGHNKFIVPHPRF